MIGGESMSSNASSGKSPNSSGPIRRAAGEGCGGCPFPTDRGPILAKASALLVSCGAMSRNRHQDRDWPAVPSDDCGAAFLGRCQKFGQPVARFFCTLTQHGIGSQHRPCCAEPYRSAQARAGERDELSGATGAAEPDSRTQMNLNHLAVLLRR